MSKAVKRPRPDRMPLAERLAFRRLQTLRSRLRESHLVASLVFTEPVLLEHAGLLVLTRGQWNGLRATIKRLGMVACSD